MQRVAAQGDKKTVEKYVKSLAKGSKPQGHDPQKAAKGWEALRAMSGGNL